ncbi:MAG TPA: hypothetical protein VD905_14475 [Flavobacteriales bacterium]|nr:hypothetical protein [Flavobacteriales bacterium]
MTRLICTIVFTLTLTTGYGQSDGEWFFLKSKGLTVIKFAKTVIITTDRRDSIDGNKNLGVDTLIILHKVEKRGFNYIITQNSFGLVSVMKIKMTNDHAFQSVLMMNPNGDSARFVHSEKDAIKRIETDTFPGLSFTCYSKDSLLKTKSYKRLKGATKEEFIAVLDTMLKRSDDLQQFINKYLNGNGAGLFVYTPLIKGEIEGGSLIINKFNPFNVKSDFNYLIHIYGKDPDIKFKLTKLNPGKK